MSLSDLFISIEIHQYLVTVNYVQTVCWGDEVKWPVWTERRCIRVLQSDLIWLVDMLDVEEKVGRMPKITRDKAMGAYWHVGKNPWSFPHR